jgi:hypothetical protein
VILAIVLAAAATVITAPPGPAVSSRVPITQATATARIVHGERITAGSVPETAMVVETEVRGSDGIERKARLVEFP